MKKEKKVRDPILIVPKRSMTKADIRLLRLNGICVVEAQEPSAVRFIEPPMMGYSHEERAAIKLSRFLMSMDNTSNCRDRHDIRSAFAHYVIQGTSLDSFRAEEPKRAQS